jgi:acyl-ACP thioesterase
MSVESSVPPINLQQTQLTVAADECQFAFRATLPAILKWLQEAAGRHAEALGVGIQALQQQGVTWMLGRLAIRLHRLPKLGEALTLNTWPNGIRGRLIAERQFLLVDAMGKPLLEASSEWLCVNTTFGKLAPLPESVKALAMPNTQAFHLCTTKLPTPPTDLEPCATQQLMARKAEMDANRHINNVHLAEWLREPLPDYYFFEAMPSAFDIEFKRSAQAGEIVTTQLWQTTEGVFLHQLTAADGTLITRAQTLYPQQKD